MRGAKANCGGHPAWRYRDQSTGRFVSRANIVGLLEAQVDSAEHRLASLTTAYYEGRLSPALWADNMRTELRRLHLQNAALGAGGFNNLTAQAYGRAGGHLRQEYARLVEFGRAIASKEITLPQALARANMYVGSARVEYFAEQQAQRMANAPDGMTVIEMRSLGAAEHCINCIDYHSQGWQPIGTLPPPGVGSVCLSNCRCSYVTRDVPLAEMVEWIGTRR
jgi:hypothetical protein